MHQNNFYIVTRITGPSHHYLALELTGTADHSVLVVEAMRLDGTLFVSNDPELEARNSTIRREVLQGVDRAYQLIGRTIGVNRIRYCYDDSYFENCYQDLAYGLVEHYVHDLNSNIGLTETNSIEANPTVPIRAQL